MSAEHNPYQGIVYFRKDKQIAYFDIQVAKRKNLEFWLKALGGSDSEFIIRYGIGNEIISFSSQDLVTDDPTEDKERISRVCDELMQVDHLEFEKIIDRPQSAKPFQEHYIFDDSDTTFSPHDHQTPDEEH